MGKKTARPAGWFKWKAENTLGKKVMSGHKVTPQKRGSALRVASPPVLQAKVTARRKAVLRVSKWSDADTKGLKEDLKSCQV